MSGDLVDLGPLSVEHSGLEVLETLGEDNSGSSDVVTGLSAGPIIVIGLSAGSVDLSGTRA